jgi:eukaryotic-like serine/threonine-protein kinase
VTLTAAAMQTTPVTQRGMIVGTFQYMSPEQVEAKELDARSDIFSFGAVLYEMVTGRRAFPGKSQLSVASAILEKEPEAISTLQPMTPPAMERLVERCLAKDPEDRWQTARDLLLELKWIGEGGLENPSRTGAGENGRRQWRLGFLYSAGALLLASVSGLVIWNLRPGSSKLVTRFTMMLPPSQRLAGLDYPAVALSEDGTKLAYVALQGGVQQIYLRAMDSLEARPISGTEGAVNPFFSPDDQWLGFFAGGKLKKVSVNGGPTLTLADVSQPRGASWGSQGTIIFAPATVSVLDQVADGGGTPQRLTQMEKGEVSHRSPEYLPGGKAMLFVTATSSFNWSNSQIAVQLLDTGERRNLFRAGMQPRYESSGHLVYAQGGNLIAMGFDCKKLAVTGVAVPVVEGVLQSTLNGAAQFSISSTGSLAYVPGNIQQAQRQMVWADRNGNEKTVAAPARGYIYPRLSPDGRSIAVSILEQDVQIWLYDLSRETLARFTLDGSTNLNPTWTPDSKQIAFQSNREGQPSIFWRRADGSGGAERLTSSEYTHVPSSWSPDGQELAFFEISPTSGYDIWVLHLADRKTRPFLQTPFNESVPRFSPDGHWLAYISNENGRFEVYVQPYPGPGGKYQISTEGATEPAWNPSGRELFYRSGDKMMAVDFSTQPNFSPGKPRVLFQGKYEPSPATHPNYDVANDGQRFLILKSNEKPDSGPTQINIVLNWSEELKRRVPSEK